MNDLVIQHVEDTDPPTFILIHGENRTVKPVAVKSPLMFPVAGQPDSNLVRQLQWYLEEFLTYPYPPRTEQAAAILDALKKWGEEAFNNLFDNRNGGNVFSAATKDGLSKLRMVISSDDPRILQWPWEALRDEHPECLSVNCLVERRLNNVREPMEISDKLPKERVNILLVTARPKKRDVKYRSISRPLVELIDREKIPAYVHVLRPPTFENLQQHIEARPHYYHIIHFDGHGGYGDASGGVLVFENDKGGPSRIRAGQLSKLLKDNASPWMVLNACQSAMLGGGSDDPFASVAASLVKAGVRGVTAMAYSLYVSAASEFLPAFYKELFATGDLSQATRAGRLGMFEQMERVCSRGKFKLRDFIVPVIYQQEPYNLPFIAGAKAVEYDKPELPEEAGDDKSPYGFIGRDSELLRLERAMRKNATAVLISGLGGVGKTTLARGLLKWLAQTEGMDGCMWLTFFGIRNAEYVISTIGARIFGPDFLQLDLESKMGKLVPALREHRFVIVWDNFEVVAGIPDSYIPANLDEENRRLLKVFLQKLKGGKSKVIITSRSDEKWLGRERVKLPIRGLAGEEVWEYCEALLHHFEKKIDRKDSNIVELVKMLDGHPLAMRVALPLLENKTARQIIDALKKNMEALGSEVESLYATLRFVENGLKDDLKPLLIPLALHEQFAQADMLLAMVKQVEEDMTQEKVDGFFNALAAAGLVRNVIQTLYELHPALTGFLRSTLLKTLTNEMDDKWRRAFVDITATIANQMAPLELHEQCITFHCHGANFRFALSEAERMNMDLYLAALTQSLAIYAFHSRNFSEANELFEKFSQNRKKTGDEEGEASAYHQLGMIAAEKRDFDIAEKLYLKALEIEEKLGNEHGAASTYHQLGNIAAEKRDFDVAEKLYLKVLEIFENLGNEHDAALTYHQLGNIAQKKRDFDVAEKWYLKTLEIKEKLGNKHSAASTYNQLGIIAAEKRDFDGAEKWCLKSLEINERLGDEHSSAQIYHQLGLIAAQKRDFDVAEKWCLKSLEIIEKLGDEHNAASTYHGLGKIAQEKRDFDGAERWYLKSLEIEKKLGNEHGAASIYLQLGNLAAIHNRFEESCKWFTKSIISFNNTNDSRMVNRCVHNYLIIYLTAPEDEQQKLRAIWDDAGLGMSFDELLEMAEKEG